MPSILRSLKTEVDPKQWEKGRGEVKGHSALAIELNSKIEEWRLHIKEVFKELDSEGHYITGQQLREAAYPPHKKQNTSTPTITKCFHDYIQYKMKLGAKKNTVIAYRQVLKLIKKLLQEHYHTDDMKVEDIDPYFMINFADNFIASRNTTTVRLSHIGAFFKWLEDRSRRLNASRHTDRFQFVNNIIVLKPKRCSIKH